MSVRWFDWLLAGLVALLVGLILVQPGAPRPEDVELQVVSVLPAAEPNHYTVTVRWNWLRRPGPWFGRSVDELGFVFDPTRLSVTRGTSWIQASVDNVILASGEPLPSHHGSTTPGESGERQYDFRWKDPASRDRWPMTIRLQYIHSAEGLGTLTDRGWVKAVDFTLPVPAQAEE